MRLVFVRGRGERRNGTRAVSGSCQKGGRTRGRNTEREKERGRGSIVARLSPAPPPRASESSGEGIPSFFARPSWIQWRIWGRGVAAPRGNVRRAPAIAARRPRACVEDRSPRRRRRGARRKRPPLPPLALLLALLLPLRPRRPGTRSPRTPPPRGRRPPRARGGRASTRALRPPGARPGSSWRLRAFRLGAGALSFLGESVFFWFFQVRRARSARGTFGSKRVSGGAGESDPSRHELVGMFDRRAREGAHAMGERQRADRSASSGEGRRAARRTAAVNFFLRRGGCISPPASFLHDSRHATHHTPHTTHHHRILGVGRETRNHKKRAKKRNAPSNTPSHARLDQVVGPAGIVPVRHPRALAW